MAYKLTAVTGGDAMTLDELRARCDNCTKCGLCETRHHVVFGEGVPESRIMFIGEGPGENEDLQGRPFVGKAGQLLDDMLEIIGLDRHRNCYITNIVKCRPPQNRDPSEAEQRACKDWLDWQMDIIRPRIVVCLGRIAANRLIHADFRISMERGRVYDKEGVRYMALYHPSALLRDESKRPDTFVDLKALKALINSESLFVRL